MMDTPQMTRIKHQLGQLRSLQDTILQAEEMVDELTVDGMDVSDKDVGYIADELAEAEASIGRAMEQCSFNAMNVEDSHREYGR